MYLVFRSTFVQMICILRNRNELRQKTSFHLLFFLFCVVVFHLVKSMSFQTKCIEAVKKESPLTMENLLCIREKESLFHRPYVVNTTITYKKLSRSDCSGWRRKWLMVYAHKLAKRIRFEGCWSSGLLCQGWTCNLKTVADCVWLVPH